MSEKFKAEDNILPGIKKSGKEELFAELMHFLSFGARRYFVLLIFLPVWEVLSHLRCLGYSVYSKGNQNSILVFSNTLLLGRASIMLACLICGQNIYVMHNFFH